MDRSDRIVLILGASGGIGSACARKFSAAGYACALQYHQNKAAIDALCAELPNAHALCADLRDASEARRLVSLAEYRLGAIDSIVYCAGTAQQKPFSDTTDEDFLSMYELHVMGAVRVVRAALGGMIDRGGGNIVLFSSMWGQVGGAAESAYSAAKGAVISLTRALAKELGVYQIRVNCVSPGLIDTPMNAMFSEDDLRPVVDATPLGRAGRPDEAAACALFLCESDASFVTGQVLSPNGGFVL